MKGSWPKVTGQIRFEFDADHAMPRIGKGCECRHTHHYVVTFGWTHETDLDAVFIGGSDRFKSAPEAFAAAKTAKWLGKHVHLGRCNTADRARNWVNLADSCDGSGMSRYDHMLLDVLAAASGNHPQQALIA